SDATAPRRAPLSRAAADDGEDGRASALRSLQRDRHRRRARRARPRRPQAIRRGPAGEGDRAHRGREDAACPRGRGDVQAARLDREPVTCRPARPARHPPPGGRRAAGQRLGRSEAEACGCLHLLATCPFTTLAFTPIVNDRVVTSRLVLASLLTTTHLYSSFR